MPLDGEDGSEEQVPSSWAGTSYQGDPSCAGVQGTPLKLMWPLSRIRDVQNKGVSLIISL